MSLFVLQRAQDLVQIEVVRVRPLVSLYTILPSIGRGLVYSLITIDLGAVEGRGLQPVSRSPRPEVSQTVGETFLLFPVKSRVSGL
ncbi:hypothetical protein RRG08_032146 [Elysia crispata]|uniref:Uncharacterized protein n=1 Tax=Elysia crispata TaxID=231223 RepID=A0AAE1ABX5_9GAST|nr:hypothetical protein RRG08_032146 [Elysia crispata]